jgi:16S rRNA (guanine966-N2)-methyltransferase
MRVVAGTARGRTIDAPPGTSTRPTSDRVRESIFNALGSLDVVVDATVLDLFAGSGALGIEALSRGAARATFVESDRRAVRVIEENLRRCGLDDRATVVTADATRFALRGSTFDLALADPPYAFDQWPDLLDAVDAETLVIESDRAVAVTARWDVVRDRTYGSTVVQIVTRAHLNPPAAPRS